MAQANRITVRMDEKEFQLLETRAQALGLTRAEVIRNALTLNDLMARMDAQRAELEALKKELWGQLTAIRTELKNELHLHEAAGLETVRRLAMLLCKVMALDVANRPKQERVDELLARIFEVKK